MSANSYSTLITECLELYKNFIFGTSLCQKKKMYWDLGILPLINLDIVAFFQNNIVKNCWNNLRRISFLGGGSSILISSTTGTGSCGGGGGGTGSGGGVGSWAGVGSGGSGTTTGSGSGLGTGTFCFFGLAGCSS